MYKRYFDILFSLFLLGLLTPIFIILICLIFIMDGYPIFFKQIRIGRYGKRFVMIKFRTMKNLKHNSTITLRGEERITKIGSFLRVYKLDELPEIYNVLIGDMSFVGPRPDVPGYADNLIGENRLILNLRPGITGPASLKYANEEKLLTSVSDPQSYNDTVIYPDKVRVNLNYYYNRSFLGDIRIILKTIFRKYGK